MSANIGTQQRIIPRKEHTTIVEPLIKRVLGLVFYQYRYQAENHTNTDT